jgi:hypothetical protein
LPKNHSGNRKIGASRLIYQNKKKIKYKVIIFGLPPALLKGTTAKLEYNEYGYNKFTAIMNLF